MECVLCYTTSDSVGGSVMAKRKRKQRSFWKHLWERALMRLEAHAREQAGQVDFEQTPTPIEAEFVRSRYQPTKAELEEDMRLPEDGGEVTLEDLKEMGRALVHPVDVTWRNKPRKSGN